MPSISEGLETGAVTTLDPFAAALEAKGITGGGDSSSLSIDEGLTFAGRTETPAEPVEETDTSDAGTDTDDEIDDDVTSEEETAEEDPLEKRYNEAQKLIGRQGQELGEARKAQQEMAERLARLEGKLEATVAAPPQQSHMSSDQIQEMIDENGALAAATWAANNAPHLVNNFLKVWQTEDPIGAMDFRDEWKAWQAQQAEAAKPVPAPSKAEERAEREERSEALGVVMTQVASEFPDFDEFKDFVPQALEVAGKIVAQAIASGDAEQQGEALRIVYDRAQRLAASEARKQAEADAKAAATARGTAGKSAARVIQSSSGTPATPKQQGEERGSQEDAVAAFKASILAADTTSVADGLTYGR